MKVVSRIVPPVSGSTDGSIGGVNSCVEGKGALVDDVVVSFWATVPPSTEVEGKSGERALVKGNGALVEEVVVSFGPTAPPSTEVEGNSVLEICVGDPLVARECGEAVFPPGDFGGPKAHN